MHDEASLNRKTRRAHTDLRSWQRSYCCPCGRRNYGIKQTEVKRESKLGLKRKVGIMQRANNSLSLRLSLAMNNAMDVSGVYNGISGMVRSDCQCLRPTELLEGV